jgi:hypothetical protein
MRGESRRMIAAAGDASSTVRDGLTQARPYRGRDGAFEQVRLVGVAGGTDSAAPTLNGTVHPWRRAQHPCP